jgi:hypothetical protein
MAFGGHLPLARTEVHNGTRWQPGAVVCLATLPANACGPCTGHDPVTLVCVKVWQFGRCQSAIWHFARSPVDPPTIVDGFARPTAFTQYRAKIISALAQPLVSHVTAATQLPIRPLTTRTQHLVRLPARTSIHNRTGYHGPGQGFL